MLAVDTDLVEQAIELLEKANAQLDPEPLRARKSCRNSCM
jgi:hypothetical protein